MQQFGPHDPKIDLALYHYPTIDLLNSHTGELPITANELDANKQTIIETLNYADIQVDKIRATIGPILTLYEIIPALGMRIAKIKGLEADIALRLAAAGTRVTGPIPGKGTIGIEVPHRQPGLVTIRSLIATEKFQTSLMALPIAFGKMMNNEVLVVDLAKMPHLLIAGATGQGKSVTINTILLSLLYKKHPAELKFVLIDVNALEFSIYQKIERHFLAKLPGESSAIITTISQGVNTLTSLTLELDQRYELFQNGQVRNVIDYNQKLITRKFDDPAKHRYLPYIVVVIDEFAGLMTTNNEVEVLIARIAQLGRAAGIHLIVSTQRPSVKTITGTIKANFTSRLAFRVATATDSRTILDISGAEQLNGLGDMLFSTGIEHVHLQGAFTETAEVNRVVDFIGHQRGYPSAMLLPEYTGVDHQPTEFDPANRDPFFEESARLIVMHQQGSTSLIQRKLKLGYNRAGRIISQLEAAGIVGPFEGSKAREVLFPDEYSLERHLEHLQTGIVDLSAERTGEPSSIIKKEIIEPTELEIEVLQTSQPVIKRKTFLYNLKQLFKR
jgi:S-DNA-T family DNA segregation ATPase FtsK/SpoIIIE